VDEVLNGICEGKPGRLKKMSNNLADGYYSATLSIRRKYWDERNLKAMSKSEREEMI
jgi:CRISPR-associated protein Csc3